MQERIGGPPVSRLLGLLTVLGLAAALAYPPLVALAEPPIEAHVIAPEGAHMRIGPAESGRYSGNFLDPIEGLDVDRQGGAIGLIRRGDAQVMVTAVRLRDAEEAARSLAAFGHGPPDDPRVEVLPEVAPDTITHRVTDVVIGVETSVVEVIRATGRDLVVFAQLDLTATDVQPFTREVVAAHLAAFPDVTPPATAGSRLGGWLLPAALGGVVVAALGLWSLRRHRERARSVPPAPIDPGQIRVNW